MGKMLERAKEQRASIVDQIVVDMTEKQLSWAKSWMSLVSPRNPISGTIYRGGNRLALSFMAAAKGYGDPRWVTFAQGKKAGWHLKKGSEHAIVEKWSRLSGERENKKTGEPEIVSWIALTGSWYVFNLSCFEGAPELVPPERTFDDNGDIADKLIKSSRCSVVEGSSDRAFYQPSKDKIIIPDRAQFISNGRFDRVLLHEMIHSTGHENALGRDLCGKFGSPDYAFEELTAELGSIFAATDIGLSEVDEMANDQAYDNHVAYLQNWIQRLENDPDELYKAAGLAANAADYLLDMYRKTVEASTLFVA